MHPSLSAPSPLQPAAEQLQLTAQDIARIGPMLSKLLIDTQQALGVLEPVGTRVRQENSPMDRLHLHALVTSPGNIEFGYQAGAVLQLLQQVQDQLKRALVVTGHYDSYVNVREVVQRKRNLDGLYRDTPLMRPVITAEQLLRILQGIRTHFTSRNMPSPEPALQRTTEIVRALLEKTDTLRHFTSMGYSIDKPEIGHPTNLYEDAFEKFRENRVPKVVTLSQIPQEYSFIAIHQAFETLFCDLIGSLERITKRGLSEEEIASELQYTTTLLDTSTSLFDVLEMLVDRGAFLQTVRECFTVASAAQSKQYHIMQNLIGMPFDDAFRERRMRQVEMIIGPSERAEVETKAKSAVPLKQQFAEGTTPVALQPLLRKLDIALLRFKVRHGQTMLKYLDPGTPGSAGTRITQYFAEITHPVFDHLFKPTEVSEIRRRADGAVDRSDQPSDRFVSVGEYVSQLDTPSPQTV